jgi:hypothetical protein
VVRLCPHFTVSAPGTARWIRCPFRSACNASPSAVQAIDRSTSPPIGEEAESVEGTFVSGSRRVCGWTLAVLDNGSSAPLLDRVARRFPYTYYVAPRFAELADLHAHCEGNAILANSMIVKLSDFPAAKRGSSCRHRVISPHLASKNYIFSKPVALLNLNVRAELREVWRDWLDEVPLSYRVEEIWDSLPPRIGKSQALKWAGREFASTRERIVSPYEGLAAARARRLIAAPEDPDMRTTRSRRPNRPPWPPHLFRDRRGSALVRYRDEDVVRLLALARILALAGLSMHVLQPSETALRNSEYYDDGT